MDDLRFYVISGQWTNDNERLYALEPNLLSGFRFPGKNGLKERISPLGKNEFILT